MGYSGTISAWGPTLLHHLAASREVIAFDPIAQGLSEEVAPTTGAITVDMLAEVSSPSFSPQLPQAEAWGQYVVCNV